MTRNSVVSSLSLSRDCVIQTRMASTHCVIKDKALLASFVDFTLKKQYICVSSAYICSAMLCDLIILLRGSMYMQNNTGPKTDPCGTPYLSVDG